MAGSHETPTGVKIQVKYQENSGLAIIEPGGPPLPVNQVKALKQTDPCGEFSFPRK